jgi:hypothetical protein
MLTVESINQLRNALSDSPKSDKAKIETVLKILNEFKAIESEVKELQKLIRQLIETKQIDKYIESNGKIYCLSTLGEFELITANNYDLKDIAIIEKEINQHSLDLETMIKNSDHTLGCLCDKRRELLKKLFSDAKNKAVKNDEILILDDNIIFLEDYIIPIEPS